NPLAITATVEVAGGRLTVDFSETTDQVAGAVNCSWAVTEGCVAYVIKLLTDSSLPSNAGLMQPIEVTTREGSLVAATFPAPVSNGNIQTSQRIVDALLGAFQQFAPRSEEHTSELQSRFDLVCRLLLEKKKKQ